MREWTKLYREFDASKPDTEFTRETVTFNPHASFDEYCEMFNLNPSDRLDNYLPRAEYARFQQNVKNNQHLKIYEHDYLKTMSFNEHKEDVQNLTHKYSHNELIQLKNEIFQKLKTKK